jgi:hypothetical protein
MNIAFWNIDKKELSDIILDLIRIKEIDILVLAECEDSTVNNVLFKAKSIDVNLNQIASKKNKLKVLSRYKPEIFTDKSDLYSSSRMVSHFVKIPNKIAFNLVSVHFHSKVNWSDQSLAMECVNLSRDILKVEEITGCENTILIGDFNMNPFEYGFVSANGLNAIPDLDYAFKKSSRIVDGSNYKFFYNPMWNYMGDSTIPFGTHYCRPSGHISYEWHFYDQVLFRPSIKNYLKKASLSELVQQLKEESPTLKELLGEAMIEKFADKIKNESKTIKQLLNKPSYIEIVTEILKESLIDTTLLRPEDKKYSDHLPVILKLNY